jgi:acyl-CoA synthetase (NDP forming)
MAYANFETLGFKGRVHLVNRRGGVIYGRNAATTCAEIGEPVDAALLMVPVEALAETFADLAAAGIPNAVILAAGFAEAGGTDRQTELIGQARAAGISLLGPNCLGFINFVDAVALWTTPIKRNLPRGGIALISQSGATASYIGSYALEYGIGFSHIVSTGNEADISVARVAKALIEEPEAKVLALFVETIRDRDSLIEAADLARQAEKPILVFKIGTSEASALAAQAHTGSLVGDDRVFDAACRQLGIIRVRSIEDLVHTADLLSRTGPIRRRHLAGVAISGGVCEIAADRAEIEGIDLAPLTDGTRAALRALLPDFATVNNPLDVTGAAVLDPTLFERSVAIMARDEDVGLVTCFADVAADDMSPVEQIVLTHIGLGLAKGGAPGLVISVTPRRVNDGVRERVAAAGVTYLPCGVHHGMTALGAAMRWSAWLDEAAGTTPSPQPHVTARPGSERAVLAHLDEFGVPVIPAVLAQSAEAAARAAADFAGPVVLKIASPDIAHKSEIGGVRLGLQDEAAVIGAYEAIIEAAARLCPTAKIEGVLVSPMRRGGLELFVGTIRDPQWGPVITLGLGGIWVEALDDTSLRLLPITEADALAMLDGLRGARLLDGYRGAPAVDRGAIARVVVRIGEAALALGPDLVSLEVNPLLATPGDVEALDGLAIWEDRE